MQPLQAEQALCLPHGGEMAIERTREAIDAKKRRSINCSRAASAFLSLKWSDRQSLQQLDTARWRAKGPLPKMRTSPCM